MLETEITTVNDENFKLTSEACLKTLRTKNALKTHLNVLTGNKPYKCDLCNDAFSIKANLFSFKQGWTRRLNFLTHSLKKLNPGKN